MSEIGSGAGIIVSVFVLQIILAFVISQGDTAPTATALGGGCTATQNATTCGQVSKTTFLAALGQVTVTGISGEPVNAPAIFSVIYVVLADAALVIGVIMVVNGILSNKI